VRSSMEIREDYAISLTARSVCMSSFAANFLLFLSSTWLFIVEFVARTLYIVTLRCWRVSRLVSRPASHRPWSSRAPSVSGSWPMLGQYPPPPTCVVIRRMLPWNPRNFVRAASRMAQGVRPSKRRTGSPSRVKARSRISRKRQNSENMTIARLGFSLASQTMSRILNPCITQCIHGCVSKARLPLSILFPPGSLSTFKFIIFLIGQIIANIDEIGKKWIERLVRI
jgi:hypothetical protein